MKLLESACIGKHRADPGLCEDVVTVTAHHAAVIDGATDKSGLRYSGVAGGLVAAHSIAQSLLGLERDATLRDLVELASVNLRREIEASAPPGFVLEHVDGPAACLVVYSNARREIWRVGSCAYRIDGEAYPAQIAIDDAAGRARAALLEALLAGENADGEALLRDDPGRGMILPLLGVQWRLANHECASYGYGVINGLHVPNRYLEVVPVPEEAEEIVLGSDGWPHLLGSLAESEEILHRELEVDPHRMLGDRPSTKGLAPDLISFDDRAYVRLSLS